MISDKKSISDYSDEMMKMYRNSNHSDIPKEEKHEEKIVEKSQENVLPETVENLPEEKSDIITETEIVTGCFDNSMFTERGYLRVKTTTGRGSIPLENVQVTVSCYKNGEYHLAGSFLTDSSGQTEIITLQAPPKSTSEKPDIRYPSALYDVSIKADGYYDVHSRDVPVFEGITSLQNVDLVPVSTGYSSSDGETIYNNSELGN